MRREFDKQKEETELIEQLRKVKFCRIGTKNFLIRLMGFQIIESRLKMSLPKDVASALTDGVVLW